MIIAAGLCTIVAVLIVVIIGVFAFLSIGSDCDDGELGDDQYLTDYEITRRANGSE